MTNIDEQLSQRHLALDPGGYFVIYLDEAQRLICAKHYTNLISDRGVALDPDGEPITSHVQVKRADATLYTGRTAKELSVRIFEETRPCPVTLLSHAAYLGREFMRAQRALETGEPYVQD